MLLTSQRAAQALSSPVPPLLTAHPSTLTPPPPPSPLPGTSLLWPSHPLLLAGHKSLEPWGYAKAQLVDEGRFVLTVDLHFDARFEGRLICGNERGVCLGRASYSLTFQADPTSPEITIA